MAAAAAAGDTQAETGRGERCAPARLLEASEQACEYQPLVRILALRTRGGIARS